MEDEYTVLFKDAEHAALYKAFVDHHIKLEARVSKVEKLLSRYAGAIAATMFAFTVAINVAIRFAVK